MFTSTTDQAPIHNALEDSFHSAFRWNFFGSIIYECIKTIHQIGLLLVIAPLTYGLMGSLFSLMYLATKIADMGATYTLPVFFSLMMKNKKNFTYFLKHYFIGPTIPLMLIITIVTPYAAYHWFMARESWWCIIMLSLLIMLETLRAFFRYLLHFAFHSKKLVIMELISFSLFVSSIWGIYLTSTQQLSIGIILLLHLMESFLIVIVFLYYTYRTYQACADVAMLNVPSNTTNRFWRARFFNFLLRLSRELFSSNVITPIFAFKFGCANTGIFYFTATLMNSLQAIIKAAIGYSGNALLAQVKEDHHSNKQQAFILVSKKIRAIIITSTLGMALIGIIYFSGLTTMVNVHGKQHLLFMGVALIIIFVSEFFVLLYDQLYIVEESAQSLFSIKCAEYIAYYLIIIALPSLSIVDLLCRMMVIRLISLSIMAYNAHRLWSLSLHYKKLHLIGCLIGGLFLLGALYR